MAAEFSSQPQGAPQSQERGHELRDASPKWIFSMVILLLLILVVIHFAIDGFLKRLNSGAAPTDVWRPVTKAVHRPAPEQPFPLLQVSPALDLRSFRAREETELNQYAWINRTAGIVRVPIERAMDMVLEKGFPVRKSTNGDEPGPSSYDLIQQRLPQEEPRNSAQK